MSPTGTQNAFLPHFTRQCVRKHRTFSYIRSMALRILSGTEVPIDIWWQVMVRCRPSEILSLEMCCKLFHNLAKSRTIWMRCLQNLGLAEPPNLPIHVSPDALSISDLRNIAVGARRRALLGASDSSPRIVREIVISLKGANPDEVLGEPLEFGMHLCLVPGGEFLLIYWPAGYLQCWSVQNKNCLWVYPDLPEGASEDRPKLLCYYDFEMQPDGDMNLLLTDEYLQGDQMGDMYPSILRFSRKTLTFEPLYTGKLLNRGYGRPLITKLWRNIMVVYQQVWGVSSGALTVFFYAEARSLVITHLYVECLEIVEDFIICVLNLTGGDKSLSIFSLADLSSAASAASEAQKIVPAADIFSAAVFLQPKSFSLRQAELSVNTLHWKAKTDQRKVYITVLYKDRVTRGTPFARFVLTRPSEASKSSSPRLEELFNDDGGDDDDTPFELSGWTFASCSALTPPTLSGQSLVLMHRSSDPYGGNGMLALGSILQEGKMKFKRLDPGIRHSEMRAVTTEFFSGAVAYATENYDSVVINYFE